MPALRNIAYLILSSNVALSCWAMDLRRSFSKSFLTFSRFSLNTKSLFALLLLPCITSLTRCCSAKRSAFFTSLAWSRAAFLISISAFCGTSSIAAISFSISFFSSSISFSLELLYSWSVPSRPTAIRNASLKANKQYSIAAQAGFLPSANFCFSSASHFASLPATLLKSLVDLIALLNVITMKNTRRISGIISVTLRKLLTMLLSNVDKPKWSFTASKNSANIKHTANTNIILVTRSIMDKPVSLSFELTDGSTNESEILSIIVAACSPKFPPKYLANVLNNGNNNKHTAGTIQINHILKTRKCVAIRNWTMPKITKPGILSNTLSKPTPGGKNRLYNACSIVKLGANGGNKPSTIYVALIAISPEKLE